MMKIMFLVFILLTILWKEMELQVKPDICPWMATQLQLSPPRDDLKKHKNWHLLPVGKCGKQQKPKTSARIYAGVDARNKYSYPWMAKSTFTGVGYGALVCGGTLISERYILSAAHCCAHLDIDWGTWFLGSHYLAFTDNEYGYMKMDKIMIHPNYTICNYTGFLKNDVCLVRLKEKVKFKANIQPICLPIKYGREVKDGEKLEVAGWGLIHSNWDEAPILQVKTVKAYTQDYCRKHRTPAIDAREICTTSGPCNGDSGGPLWKWFSKNYEKTYYQYGIISTGSIDCQNNDSVYPRVTEYMEWILDNMAP